MGPPYVHKLLGGGGGLYPWTLRIASYGWWHPSGFVVSRAQVFPPAVIIALPAVHLRTDAVAKPLSEINWHVSHVELGSAPWQSRCSEERDHGSVLSQGLASRSNRVAKSPGRVRDVEVSISNVRVVAGVVAIAGSANAVSGGAQELPLGIRLVRVR